MAVLALVAVVGSVAYQSEAREREYRLLLSQGDAALAAEQIFGAIEAYSGAIALRPDSMLAHLRRGETYHERGDLDSAVRDFRTAATLDPNATRPLDQWAEALYEQQRYKRAAEVYETRLKLDDRSPIVRYRLGLTYYRDGNLDAALHWLGQAIKADDRMPDAHYLTALCYREQGDEPKALAALGRAIERAPGSIPAREELADVYHARGDRSQEVEQLQILAALDGQVERRIAVALAHARAGHSDLAVLTLASAIEEWPNQPLLYGALGRIWLDIARTHRDRPDALAKALEALERAASAPNATSEVKTLYGQALFRDDQLEAAEGVLKQATERFPAYPDAFSNYAIVAERLNHPEAARAALLTYNALVGDDAGFEGRALKLGELSLRLNDAENAVAWLQRAEQIDPSNVTLLGMLGDAHLRIGDTETAREVLDRGLAIDPENRSLRALLRKASAPKR